MVDSAACSVLSHNSRKEIAAGAKPILMYSNSRTEGVYLMGTVGTGKLASAAVEITLAACLEQTAEWVNKTIEAMWPANGRFL